MTTSSVSSQQSQLNRKRRWAGFLNFRRFVVMLEHAYLILVLYAVIIIAFLAAYSGVFLVAPVATGFLLGVAMGFFFGLKHLGETWLSRDSWFLITTLAIMALWLYIDWMPSYDYQAKTMMAMVGYTLGVLSFKALRYHGYFRSVTEETHRVYYAKYIEWAKRAIARGVPSDELNKGLWKEPFNPLVLRPKIRDDVFQGNVVLSMSLAVFLLIAVDIGLNKGFVLLFAPEQFKLYQWLLLGAITMIVMSSLFYLTPSAKVIPPIIRWATIGLVYGTTLRIWLNVDVELMMIVVVAAIGIGFSYFLAREATAIQKRTAHRFWQSEITDRQYLDLYRLSQHCEDLWEAVITAYRQNGKITQSTYFRWIENRR